MTAEVPTTRRQIRMFSTFGGAGQRLMSIGKWIKKFRVRTACMRKHIRIESTDRENGTD